VLKPPSLLEKITIPAQGAAWSARSRREGASIGFVPTMGALHEGHLDLVHRAKAVCDKVVCSIFVNPLQFSNSEDLNNYPRQLERDSELLEQVGCDMLFTPEKESIFTDFTPTKYDLEGLDDHWEGPSRPGHFQGVVNVVERLFFYVRPDQAFFGEKDRQQLTILRAMAKQQRWPVTITPCQTVRSADGLALSSRNQRLDPVQREQATVLYRTLKTVEALAFRSSVENTRKAALAVLESEPEVVLDHLGFADAETLHPIIQWDPAREAIALIAAQVGPVRLIDNITLHPLV